jgi:cytochrome c
MLPHPQHSIDELHQMVRYIYALEPGKGAAGLTRSLAGESAAPADPAISGVVLDATFTDAGRDAVPPLAGHSKVTLRPRQLEAEQAAVIHGSMVLGLGGASGGKGIGSIGHQHHAKFPQVALDQSGAISCRVASAGSGGTIEVRAGSPEGKLLASLEVKPTGAWDKWIEITAPLPAALPRTDVFVVFVRPGVGGGMMNLDWVRFEPH